MSSPRVRPQSQGAGDSHQSANIHNAPDLLIISSNPPADLEANTRQMERDRLKNEARHEKGVNRIIDFALRRQAQERGEQVNKTLETTNKEIRATIVEVDGQKVIEGVEGEANSNPYFLDTAPLVPDVKFPPVSTPEARGQSLPVKGDCEHIPPSTNRLNDPAQEIAQGKHKKKKALREKMKSLKTKKRKHYEDGDEPATSRGKGLVGDGRGVHTADLVEKPALQEQVAIVGRDADSNKAGPSRPLKPRQLTVADEINKMRRKHWRRQIPPAQSSGGSRVENLPTVFLNSRRSSKAQSQGHVGHGRRYSGI